MCKAYDISHSFFAMNYLGVKYTDILAFLFKAIRDHDNFVATDLSKTHLFLGKCVKCLYNFLLQ